MLINIVVFPAIGLNLSSIYPIWLLIPTIIFFFSPTLNDFFSWFGRINVFKYLLYLISVIILYGSMLLTSLISAILGIFGKKAVFVVTPKDTKKINLWDAIKIQYKELIFAVILIVISILISKSILPIILISGTSILSIVLLLLSNKTYDEENMRANDSKTASITLSQNPLVEDDIELSGLDLERKKIIRRKLKNSRV